MSFVRGLENDGRQMGNDMIINFFALYTYNRFLASHIVNQADSPFVATLKAAGVVTGVEELKRILRDQFGMDLNVFH